jgi:sec-independent protein translocase protein TatA
MPMFGPWELVILLIIVVVIFGAGRLSQIGGALGKSVREFRSATQDELAAKSSTAGTSKSVTTVAVPGATVVTTTAPVTKACPSCGHANAATLNFCSECGTALAAASEPRENTCPSCATVNPAGQAFCGQCGTRLTTRAA